MRRIKYRNRRTNNRGTRIMKTINRRQLYLIIGIILGLALVCIYLFHTCNNAVKWGITLSFTVGAICGIAMGLADGIKKHKPTGLIIMIGVWIVACVVHYFSLNNSSFKTLYLLYLLQLADMIAPWAIALHLSRVEKHDKERWL